MYETILRKEMIKVKLNRTQLSKRYNINRHQWERRHDEVLDYLSGYMSIEEICPNRCYYYIIDDDAPTDIPSFKEFSNQQRSEDFRAFVKENLSEDFQYESYYHMARQAIKKFAKEKYNYKNYKYLASKYIKPIMLEEGIATEEKYWAILNTNIDQYLEPTTEQISGWFRILEKYKFTALEARNAIIQTYQTKNYDAVDEQLNRYKSAIEEWQSEYGLNLIPIHIKKWKEDGTPIIG